MNFKKGIAVKVWMAVLLGFLFLSTSSLFSCETAQDRTQTQNFIKKVL